MRRISLIAALAATALLALAGTASADIGDIDLLEINDDPEGTAEAAEISGQIRCNTTIDYGVVVKVAQDDASAATDPFSDNNADIEGVGAFGPNQGNEANTPCSTNLQSYEVVIQRNRDSGTYVDSITAGENMGIFVTAGTSANDGDRGPGPFIGDSEYALEGFGQYTRTDP